ncbi:ImmA/IrrE family metallo-endopeptidase [Helcococcus bovis]|uniref:ImmA/IrrE family metallo-endopeptidase n=1 Tax=Helcococcus bovis TaxID=3153252 RepID=UPI0038BB084B
MKWIDEIVAGLIENIGSNNLDDILSELQIYKFIVEPDNSILQDNQAVYQRVGDFECIYVANDVLNKDFVIAHEIGHAILHVDEMMMFYNPLLNKGKLEREADYFATRLLYSNLEIEEGIETYEQLANMLGIKEKDVKYIVNDR